MMTTRKKFFGKLFVSIFFPLLAFRVYWAEFDGAYTNMDLLLGGVVTVALCTAVFMYFSIANKIERFSPAWFFALLIVVNLVVFGWIISSLFSLPIAYRAAGMYMLSFGLLLPMIHFVALKSHTSQKGSFYKRIRLNPTENAQG